MGDFEREPLVATSYSVSTQGLLQMEFNYPLAYEVEDKELEEWLMINVVSSAFEPEDSEIQINNLTLVDFNDTSIDVQVEFNSPTSLSMSAVFPELLEVTFKEELRSIDSNI